MKTKKIFLTLSLVAAALLFASCKLGLLNVGLGDKVDILPPGITIVPMDGVQNGAYIHGKVTVHGKVSDDVGATSVTWMFADEPNFSPTYTATLEADNTWWFELDTFDEDELWIPALHADGDKTFTITVTDGAGKSTETRMLLIFDNTPPSATFINPEDGASIYGQVNLRGSSSDNTSLIKVQVRIGKYPSRDDPDELYENGFTTITGSKYDWVRSFTAVAYKDPDKATDNGDDTWTLPIYVRVYDYAGNVSTNEPLSDPLDLLYPTKLKEKYKDALKYDAEKIPPFELIIDSNLDKPTASIQIPHESSTLAGTVVASGSCFDENPGIGMVEMRVMALEDDDSEIGWVTPGGGIPVGSEWSLTTLSGGAYWQASLNTNENLYNVTAPGGIYEGMGEHNGKLRIDVKPTDGYGTPGNIQTVTFTLDQTVPYLKGPVINKGPQIEVNGEDKDAWDYLYVRGDIVLKATAIDNEFVDHLWLSLDNGETWGSDLGTHAASLPLAELIHTFTDTRIPSAIRTEKNGQVTMVVKLQDNALHFNNWTVRLNLDNRYPDKNDYTGLANGHDPMNLHEGLPDDHSQVMGTCADTGSVSGIDMVEVYLTRWDAGVEYVINLTNGNLVPKIQDLFGDPQSLQDYTTDPSCKLVIDWNTYADKDLDQVGSDVKWWANLDTSIITDGDVDIHYMAWDKAGNAVHGEEPGFIKNHAPVIETVTVGTDLDDNDTVGTGETVTYDPGTPPSPITARNDWLYIKINATETGKNTPFVYSVKNKFYETGTELANTSTGVALIDISSGRFGGDGNGKVFTVKITDAVGIEDSKEVTVNIDNVDGEKPTITVSAIGAPADLLDWDTNPVAGHIEAIGISTYDNAGTADADVSGTVMVRGTAHDNVRIDAITLSIDGGAPSQVAHWDVTGLVSDLPASFHIVSETLADVGHDVHWDYKWNTAGITTVAKNNVVLSFVATDHSANTSLNPEHSHQYDVVPYINQVDTVIAGLISKDFARSALGRYSVRAGETITIKGYNLKPANTGIGAGASDVRIVGAAARDNVGQTGRGLVYAGVGSPYTSMTADITLPSVDGSIGSGYLVVWVNGVPSLNARSGRSNAETNFVSQTGTDERWLSVWNLTRLKDSAPNALYGLYPSMAMYGDDPHFAYVNNAAGYGQAKYWNGTTGIEKSIYNNWDLFTYSAISVNSNGNHGVLFDINVVNGNNGDYNPGNSGGILTSFYSDVPAHTWSSCYDFKPYHVWLDNLVDTRHYHVGTVDRSAGFNWSATNQTLIVTTTAGGPTPLTLDSNCASVSAIVAHINSKLASAPGTPYYHANFIEAFDAGSGHVGMRIKGNPSGGGDQSYTLGAGTANATMGFTAGTYAGVAAILDRYRFPDLLLRGTTALSTAYYSVYDSMENKVIVRTYKVGTDTVQVGSGNKVNSSGLNLYTNIGQYAGSGSFPLYDGTGNTGGSTTQTNSRFYSNTTSNPAGRSPDGAYTLATGAGPWTAVAATSGGVLLAVWYETGTNELKYAYNTTPSVTGGGTFTGTKVLDSLCGGDYVDMVVDSGAHVHIAYHDSYSGDLKYVYLASYNAAPDGPFVVDSYLTVGNKTGIAVSAAGVPYITYKGMGNTAKAAWLVGSLGDGADGSGKFNGAWEVQVLPIRIVDNDTNRFCMGVDTKPLPVVGYTNSGTGIEYIRRRADLP